MQFSAKNLENNRLAHPLGNPGSAAASTVCCFRCFHPNNISLRISVFQLLVYVPNCVSFTRFRRFSISNYISRSRKNLLPFHFYCCRFFLEQLFPFSALLRCLFYLLFLHEPSLHSAEAVFSFKYFLFSFSLSLLSSFFFLFWNLNLCCQLFVLTNQIFSCICPCPFVWSLTDLGGYEGCAPLTPSHIFFQFFMQFWAKKCQIIGQRPSTLRLASSHPLGNPGSATGCWGGGESLSFINT